MIAIDAKRRGGKAPGIRVPRCAPGFLRSFFGHVFLLGACLRHVLRHPPGQEIAGLRGRPQHDTKVHEREEPYEKDCVPRRVILRGLAERLSVCVCFCFFDTSPLLRYLGSDLFSLVPC